ncbi:hypothetical protein A3J90_00940 [candidate division WOR-1 bacterium RIFOXYC2_FULL_37_10]|uniref:Galactosyldiacylglycerol synthase n=1 Tax=candidate division WOR-1 bacterium RIFOXYB2_FULL_37_13 TaxID=1802579 RepID=A0A1F4STR1_UNCSA|nr:MAG: hypothetical protein A2310_04335 [candidate division WOR-1 bacterium RIFOXYB2_FULL_37_13]OGC33274.1 MAG: hypothetical protein A3J90_00940 [candidate division WOR-1 bacterium RIFOXYC2_FULL_37_10]
MKKIKKKNILYLFSDTGGGHRAGAKSLMEAVEELKPQKYNQEMIDVFAKCSGFLNVFAKLYAPLINNIPKFWGTLYRLLDNPSRLKTLEKISKPFIQKELIKLIKNKNPDIIVSVHPLINQITAQAIKETGKKIPFIVVVMDPVTFHRAWITPDPDMFILATEEAKRLAIEYGLPPKKAKVIGLPINPKFSKKQPGKTILRKQDGLDLKLFTILLMGGGEGAGGIDTIIDAINRSALNLQLIVITGRNKKLKSKLEKVAFRMPVKIYGFTNEVPRIMAESDLIITKGGPGAVAESLAMNLPMIITSWLPGQEEGNVEFVQKNKLGYITKEPQKVVHQIKELQDPKIYKKIQLNIRRNKKPNAVFDIASNIIGYL